MSIGSGAVESGATGSERSSVMGKKMGRERKENVKKERKWKKKEIEEKKKEKVVSVWWDRKRK